MLIDGADAARLTVAQLASRVGLVFQDPDRQIFSGSVRAEVEFGPRNLGRREGRSWRAAVDAAPGGDRPGRRGAHQPVRPGRLRAASSSRSHRCSPWGRRCSSSTSRPPARTLAASSGCAAIVEEVAGGRADGDRHQPRHALRGRDVRAGGRHARRARHPRRPTGRGLRRSPRGRRCARPISSLRRPPGGPSPRAGIHADRRRFAARPRAPISAPVEATTPMRTASAATPMTSQSQTLKPSWKPSTTVIAAMASGRRSPPTAQTRESPAPADSFLVPRWIGRRAGPCRRAPPCAACRSRVGGGGYPARRRARRPGGRRGARGRRSGRGSAAPSPTPGPRRAGR